MIDSPTLTSATVANYAVLNPVMKSPSMQISDGNLKSFISSNTAVCAGASFGLTSGKWYWEAQVLANPVGSQPLYGIALSTFSGFRADGVFVSYTSDSWGLNASDGTFRNNGTTLATYSSIANGDVVMLAIDMDNNKFWMGKNGTWFNSGVPASGTGAILTSGLTGNTVFPAVTEYGGTSSAFNFGQRPFAYTPPTGFNRLNTYNLPDSTIKKGNTVMDAVLWTGAGQTGAASITGLNFKPDFVWAKMRSSAISHTLYNSIVGGGANKALSSNGTDTEASFNANATNGYLSSFDSNGFSYFGGSSPAYFSSNGNTYVGWAWQAGQGTTSSNTSGTITSTVSVNATAGFSVVTYTGIAGNVVRTFGHGLGVAPKMVIVKDRVLGITGTDNWVVYHASATAAGFLLLNTTAAYSANANYWGNTAPTSTVVSVGGNASNVSNESGVTYVAYCWAEIAGFSKFGSYVGNANADGPFIYTGFRPKFVMFKRTDSTGSWEIQDTSRSDYNVISKELYANLSDAEYDDIYNNSDFLSNGFKIRSGASSGNNNPSGGTIIYMAFAENPFKNSLAR
jgi:hypothetical protein